MNQIYGVSSALPLTQQQNTKTVQKPEQSFQALFQDALHKVNQYQAEADHLTQKLATGELEDIHQVMTASQKANLSLQLTVQVRNKVIESYQEIMRMQV